MTTPESKPKSATHLAFIAKGWTIRTAATLLGVHYSHLHHVLTGYRDSARLMARIENLPVCKASDKHSKIQNR